MAMTMAALGSVRMGAQGGPPAGVPAQAAAVFEGDLEVLVEDATTGARYLHFLQVPGRRLQLDIPGNRSNLTTGTRVRARGQLNGNTLALSSANDLQAVSALAVPNTFGVQRTVVILVTFAEQTTQPYAPSHAQAVTFTETSNYFFENSYGQTSLAGAVLGWYKIAESNTTCDYNRIASQADAAAIADGKDLSTYTRKIYAFTNGTCFGWWGLGTIGGNPSRSWVNGSYALRVVGHELGHNFGDHHSHSRWCDSTACSTSEYGDTHDIMGASSGHFNAFQKDRLGWLNYASQPTIQTVSAAGDYWIEAMSAPRAGAPKALRFLRGVDSANRRLWYYIEARVRTGADSNLAPGVLIHTATEGDYTSSYLTDLFLTTSTTDYVLDYGQVFEDAAAGLFVTNLGTTATGATVNVNYQAPPCTANTPTVTLSPAGSRWAAVGTPVSYSVTIANTDSWSCSAAAFDLSAATPAGWTSSFGASPVTVQPGSSASASFVLTSALSSPAGAYGFQVNATRSGPSGSASGSLTIVTALDVAVTAAASGSQYTLTATVGAGGVAASGAAVSFRVTDPAGAMTTINATTNASGVATAKFRPARRGPSGLYQVRATATGSGLTGVGNTMFVR
jgi:hypothetical protein